MVIFTQNSIPIQISKKPLIEYFNNLLKLNTEEENIVKKVFTESKVQKRQFILQEGDICELNTFVVRGCFEMYLIDDNGKENNLQFAIENW